MAWSCRKNARHRNPKKDVRKAVCNKTKRKTKNEMAGWRVHGPEKDGDKRMERQSKGSRGLEAYCKGGQGPPRAVAPLKKLKILERARTVQISLWHQGKYDRNGGESMTKHTSDMLVSINIAFFHGNSTRYACCQLKFVPGSTDILKENAVFGKFARGLAEIETGTKFKRFWEETSERSRARRK